MRASSRPPNEKHRSVLPPCRRPARSLKTQQRNVLTSPRLKTHALTLTLEVDVDLGELGVLDEATCTPSTSPTATSW